MVQNSKGMSARASKSVIKNGLANISDDMILRLLKKQIAISNEQGQSESSNIKKKYEYKTKWDLILKVKD